MAPQNGKFITLDIFREGQVHPLSPYHHPKLWKHFCEFAKIPFVFGTTRVQFPVEGNAFVQVNH